MKKYSNIIIGVLIVILFLILILFLDRSLKFRNIQKNDSIINVLFTNVVEEKTSADVETSTSYVYGQDSITFIVDTTLHRPNEMIRYNITIANNGTEQVIIEDIDSKSRFQKSDDNIEIITVGIEKNDVIKPNESKDIVIIIRYVGNNIEEGNNTLQYTYNVKFKK